MLTAAALAHLLRQERPGGPRSPWDIPDGWRVGGPAWTTVRLISGTGDPVPVRIRGRAGTAAEVSVGGADPVAAHAEFEGGTLVVISPGPHAALRVRARGRRGRSRHGLAGP